MGVLMVRKEVKRGTSLLMGISVAVLLGAAATFLVLALPQQMLEGLTTTVGLSRIMVQAEPPISPNDRMLLSVLAGLGTAGIGWVLVDWLLFGRVGMSTIIRPREDEYEDEDDIYRPSNPLDLVSEGRTVTLPTPVNLSSDPRRPLSARTDIGDPPMPSFAAIRPEDDRGTYDIGIGQLLPPLDQLLPEASASPSPVTPPPVVAPATAPTLPPLELSNMASLDMPDIPMRAPTPGPLVFPTAAEIASGSIPARAVTAPTLVIPEPVIQPEPLPVIDPAPIWPNAPAASPPPPPVMSGPLPPLMPPAPAPDPSFAAPIPPDVREDRFASFPPNLPDFLPIDAPFLTPQPNEPLISQAAPRDVPMPMAPPKMPPPAPIFADPAPVRPPVSAAPTFEPDPAPAPSRPAAPTDRAPLGDLLARLESGMHKRRPTTPPPQLDMRPAEPVPEPVRRPLPPYASAPAQMVDVPPAYVPPTPPPVAPARPVFQADPLPAPQPAPTLIPQPSVAPAALSPSSGDRDGLLDQPLHVALDVLRNRVRRSG